VHAQKGVVAWLAGSRANQFFKMGRLLGWQLHCHPGKSCQFGGGSTTAAPTPWRTDRPCCGEGGDLHFRRGKVEWNLSTRCWGWKLTSPLLTFGRSVLLAAAIALSVDVLFAQQAAPSRETGQYGSATPKEGAPSSAPTGQVAPGSADPNAPQRPAGDSVKPVESPGKPGQGDKPAAGPKPLQRPLKPVEPPNRDELKVRPDREGRIRLNFNGQSWPGVLEWLADISRMSLDWQELPADYLNLRTQRSYTVREVQDLINRHLLARGFTLLRHGETLTVVNIKKLDGSLVPRLNAEDLDRRDPHEFVKVSFALDWLLAETAARELAPMLSPNGKLTALAELNRIEAIDTVANLRDVYAVLKREQSGESRDRLVRQFKLHYAPAEHVRDELAALLGAETKSRRPDAGLGQASSQAQQAMMLAQMQQAGGQGQPGGGQGQPGGGQGQPAGGAAVAAAAAVTLVADRRENTILAIGRPDKMAIIVRVIEALDVPADADRSLVSNVNRMQVYRLVGIDPGPVVKTLEEIGNLSPTARLEVDAKNKAIVAYAPLADQVVIRTVVEKLSGSERKFEMFPLRRLRADEVAGTVAFMMGFEPKKKKERVNPWYYGYSSERESTAERPNEFRVDADVEHNRLLLWANDIELNEVRNLLVKLGEIPAKGSRAESLRVIDGGRRQETEELLERIRRTWPSVAPNPLVLPPAAPKKSGPEAAPPDSSRPQDPSLPPSRTTAQQPAGAALRWAVLRGDGAAEETVDGPGPGAAQSAPPMMQRPEGANPTAESAGKSPPPVTVAIGPDGKLVISSDDAQALDRLEELIAESAGPRKNYSVFHLKYAEAIGVSLTLEEFFKEDKKEPRRWSPWWDYGFNQDDADKDERRLSKRRTLKFIPDSDSNSILAVGADSEQLKTIQDLIRLYDQPPPMDTQSVRKQEVFRLRHAKARVVAETVKDVYRDLLSANDKALAGANQQQRNSQRTFIYDYGGPENKDKGEQKAPRFKGLLSIGVDELSNALVVSAPAYLFDHVKKMVDELDEAAAGNNTVRVVKVGRGVTAARLAEMLDALQNPGSSAGRRPAETTPARPPAAKARAKPAATGGNQPANHRSTQP
jgi:type II secretory pathway component GspD/PulD (secretin)